MKNLKQAQHVMALFGPYTGAIDGVDGPRTRAAADELAEKHTELRAIPVSRRAKAAAQLLLNLKGYEAGAVDGYWGHNSENAYQALLYEQANGKPLNIPQVAMPRATAPSSWAPHQRDVRAFYGTPGKGGPIEKQLVRVPTYEMRIDWALHQRVNSITLHKKCAPSAEAAFRDIHKSYGGARLHALGLDRFAGSYNPRKMRGGTSWSMHAYGCAIDFYARPNGLTMRCPDALFCGPEYVEFFDIWEAHGWTSLGRAIGRDWMHVQAARL